MKKNKLQIKFFGWKSLLKTSFLTLGLVALFTQCYKDHGNYDYIKLDGITIDRTDVEAHYSLDRYDTLKIAPRVFLNGQEVTGTSPSLEFQWVMYPASSIVSTVSSSRRDTIANTYALDFVVSQEPELWEVAFSVTHRETGVKEYTTFRVTVNDIYPDGWLVLYERNGDTDMGLIVNDWIKLNYAKDVHFLDLLYKYNGARLSGKPMSVSHSLAPPAGALDILVASENDMVGVHRTSFQRTLSFENFFFPGAAPDVKKVTNVGVRSNTREGMINNNRVHFVNYQTMGSNRTNQFYGLPVIVLGEDHGELAHWMARAQSGSFEAIVYDQTNQRFLAVRSFSVELGGFATQVVGTDSGQAAFDVNNVGMQMLVSDFGRNPTVGSTIGYEYSIMKDGSNYALLISNFANTNALTTNNIGIAKHSISHLPGIADVTGIAPGWHSPFIYYSCKSKVHLFRYEDASPYSEQWTAPAGEEITLMRLQTYVAQASANNATWGMTNNWGVIYIATWNGTEGKVYSFKVDVNSGVIDTSVARSYTGFGRIKDMAWKSAQPR